MALAQSNTMQTYPPSPTSYPLPPCGGGMGRGIPRSSRITSFCGAMPADCAAIQPRLKYDFGRGCVGGSSRAIASAVKSHSGRMSWTSPVLRLGSSSRSMAANMPRARRIQCAPLGLNRRVSAFFDYGTMMYCAIPKAPSKQYARRLGPCPLPNPPPQGGRGKKKTKNKNIWLFSA